MSTITPTTTRIPGGALKVVWSNMANGDVGSPVENAAYADRSVQVSGTFGAGGTAVIEGTINESTYATLNDMGAAALSLTSAAIKSIMDVPVKIRPSITAGDGTTSITVAMIMRRNTGDTSDFL